MQCLEPKDLPLSSPSTGKKRIDAFDIMKGITILLMIVGHTTGQFASLRNFIFSFHMPLFFVIAGYFFRPLPLWAAVRKNFRRLYVPYLFTALLLAVHILVQAYCYDMDLWNVFLTRLRATLLGSGAPRVLGMKPAIGAIWFLAAMFWALLWLNLALRTRFPWLIALLLAALSFYLQGKIFLPQSIQPSCSAVLFLYVGYAARQTKVLERAGCLTWNGLKQLFVPPLRMSLSGAAPEGEKESASARLWWWAFGAIALWVTAWLRGKLEMSCDYYRLWYFDMLAAVAAVWLVYQLSLWLDRSRFHRLKRFFCFFGRYSLVVLCFHLYELNCLPLRQLLPADWGDAALPLLWALKFVWAYLCILLVLHVPFLRRLFQIK